MNRLFTGSILGLTVMVLTACESMTGKTAGQSIDDATVTASVQAKLTKDKLSNFSRINVDTDRNVVSLNGVVQTVEDKSRAEDLARQVTGVSNVNNNLQIQSLADAMTSESEPSQRVEGIKGEVSRIEGDTYFVRGESGKEVRLHTDDTTQKTGPIHEGDRIEAQMNEQNHALSIRSTPTTDRRNEKSESMLTQ